MYVWHAYLEHILNSPSKLVMTVKSLGQVWFYVICKRVLVNICFCCIFRGVGLFVFHCIYVSLVTTSNLLPSPSL